MKYITLGSASIEDVQECMNTKQPSQSQVFGLESHPYLCLHFALVKPYPYPYHEPLPLPSFSSFVPSNSEMTQSFHNGPLEMASLTAEQQERIRFNKERALAKRAVSLQNKTLLQPPQPASSLWNLPNSARASIPNGVGSGVTGRNQHLPLTLTLPLPLVLVLVLALIFDRVLLTLFY